MLYRLLCRNVKPLSVRMMQNMTTAKKRFRERFEVKRLTEADKHEAAELMKKHFVDDYVLQYIPNLQLQDVDSYIKTSFDMCLKQNYSFAIFEKSSSSVIAAVLNYIWKKNQNPYNNKELSPAL